MAELNPETQARIISQIAQTINAQDNQVQAAIKLLDAGDSVPFIARYRKEVTGGLDDAQLRTLEVELIYARSLEERRAVIIATIESQGKLTKALSKALNEANTKQRLEDLYLPFKPKRRTKAQSAREAGLEPLAMALLENRTLDPEAEAVKFVNLEKGIASVQTALDGARDILTEHFSENADMLGLLRSFLWENGSLASKVEEGKEKANESAKYRDYFDYSEPIAHIPSHRALALFRGREEGVLKLRLALSAEDEALPVHPCEKRIAEFLNVIDDATPCNKWLTGVIHWTWRVKCSWQLESELFSQLRDAAQTEAINVFGTNLRDLLLAAPAGHKGVIGLDPGIRTGVKVAVISDTGAVLDTTVIYPHEPKREWDQSIETLAQLAEKYHSVLISIGNGTASRETDSLAADLISRHPELNLTKVVVNESGASVYSASEAAAEELPNMDVSFRGAVSIARRLQDPLAELVKIEPKAIGVGQYQHDVNQIKLADRLDAVVEDCVNAVGVDLNTASAALLRRVAGLNSLQAKRIVSFREENGAFPNRQSLLDVPRLGKKAFEQAAGFLRIPDGENPLDASGVHPESYPVVEKILAETGLSIHEIIGNHEVLSKLRAIDFTDDRFGLPTVLDILKELEKPGRDPRPEFRMAKFSESVHKISDLAVGMELEGVITNVAVFGAFVDIGVHQDGLIHVSEISDRYIKDPRDALRVGEIVKVRVIEIDANRKRVSLSMKSVRNGKTQSFNTKPALKAQHTRSEQRKEQAKPVENHQKKDFGHGNAKMTQNRSPVINGAMAQAFAGLKLKR